MNTGIWNEFSEKFKTGDMVEHKLNKEWLLVLKANKNDGMYCCRTKSLKTEYFYEFELRKVIGDVGTR